MDNLQLKGILEAVSKSKDPVELQATQVACLSNVVFQLSRIADVLEEIRELEYGFSDNDSSSESSG